MLAHLSTTEIYDLLSGPMPRVAGLCALVVGMGRSGEAAAELLRREGARVLAIEDNKERNQELRKKWLPRGVQIVTSEMKTLAGIDFVVLSPGVPWDHPLVQSVKNNNVLIVGEMELASRFLTRPIVAITGTNGKTTVTHMTGHALRECGFRSTVAGNVGYPLAQLAVDGERNSLDPIVIEVSSYQCETFDAFLPQAATITNLAPDHLDRYESLDAYYQTKFRIALRHTANEALWLGPGVEGLCPDWVASTRRSFDLDTMRSEGLFYVDGALVYRDGSVEERLEWPSLAVLPRQTALNRLAAIGLCLSYDVPLRDAAQALETFVDLPHRMEAVSGKQGVRFFNDSKATNLHALETALHSLPGNIHLIAGGMGKGEPLEPLIDLLKDKVKAIYLIGRDAELFEAAWGTHVATRRFESLDEATREAIEAAKAGDIVLLSPAAASWDMFRSYEERGDRFKALVQEARS